jgi:hypothetical protein
MNDQHGMISRRRAFSLLGLGAALSTLAPTMMLSASEAEAQTAGMERREGRRTGRQERRETRRTVREQRRETRRGGGEPTTTGAAPTGTAPTGTK